MTPKRFNESPGSALGDGLRDSYKKMKFPKIESSPRVPHDREFLSNHKLSHKRSQLE